MKKISFSKTTLQKSLLSTFFALGLFFTAQAQLSLTVATTQNGNEVSAEFLAYNFTDILTFQFTVNWDQTQMEFVEVSNYGVTGMSPASFGIANVSNGALTTSWIDPLAFEGVTLAPCYSIFTVKFELIGTEIPAITFGNAPTPIEIMQSTGFPNAVDIGLVQNSGCDDLGFLDVNVFNDLDLDCTNSAGDFGLENWIVKIVGNGFTFYRDTDANGEFSIFLSEGEYDLTLTLPENNLWGVCDVVQNATIIQDETIDVAFPAQALVDCPSLSVDLSAPFLRRCFPSQYQVQYCNDGTEIGEDAYIEIEFDDDMEVISSSLPWSSVDGNTYTFPIGIVDIGQCGSFNVEVIIDCEAELGATHCSEAHIYPDDTCIPPSVLWDGSSLQIEGECNGDEVVFTITNVGNDMQTETEFVIIEDDMMAWPATTLFLNSLEVREVILPADGTSYRIEVTQSDNHPGLSAPNASVEGCLDGAGTFSMGFVTQFPQNDNDPWIDIDCQENTGSWDPNDKIGFPIGYGNQHFIKPGTEIEYRIRFQNTGTDTAFNISVLDTLSPFLDPITIRPGSSSHPYEFELSGAGVLKFNFPSIMLPDSSTNLVGSNGFVKFNISPREGIALGSVIENTAAIYFDFNQPVITNTYFHTVDEDFIMQEPNAVGFKPFSDVQVFLTPNPMADGGRPLLLVESQITKLLDFQIFDAEGKMLFAGNDTATAGSSIIQLPVNLPRGTFFVQVTDQIGQGITLKLLVR